MSDVLHSAGDPGASRCSATATGSNACLVAGDPRRLELALACAHEIDALTSLLRGFLISRGADCAQAGNVHWRILDLIGVQKTALGVVAIGEEAMADITRVVTRRGDRVDVLLTQIDPAVVQAAADFTNTKVEGLRRLLSVSGVQQ